MIAFESLVTPNQQNYCSLTPLNRDFILPYDSFLCTSFPSWFNFFYSDSVWPTSTHSDSSLPNLTLSGIFSLTLTHSNQPSSIVVFDQVSSTLTHFYIYIFNSLIISVRIKRFRGLNFDIISFLIKYYYQFLISQNQALHH